MNRIVSFLLIVFSLTVVGCAGPISKDKLPEIKTIAVWNTFPEFPRMSYVGITVFNNRADEINDPSYFELVENIAINFLKAKKYTVIEIDEKPKHKDDQIDLYIELSSGSIYNMPYTYGYGFYQRGFLGIGKKPFSHAEVHISRYTPGVLFSGMGVASGASQTELFVNDLPASWLDFSASQRKELEEMLKQNIIEAMEQALIKAGL